MVVYKLYDYHKMSLLISIMISLMVIPVLWIVAHYFPSLLWYSYLIAYVIELLIIFIVHKVGHYSNTPATQKLGLVPDGRHIRAWRRAWRLSAPSSTMTAHGPSS